MRFGTTRLRKDRRAADNSGFKKCGVQGVKGTVLFIELPVTSDNRVLEVNI